MMFAIKEREKMNKLIEEIKKINIDDTTNIEKNIKRANQITNSVRYYKYKIRDKENRGIK